RLSRAGGAVCRRPTRPACPVSISQAGVSSWRCRRRRRDGVATLPSRSGRIDHMWRASILTLFPDMFPGPLGFSPAGKALAAGLWTLDAVDIRGHATDKHRSVDDTPAGGGPGMVMRADVLARAIDAMAPAGDARPR